MSQRDITLNNNNNPQKKNRKMKTNKKNLNMVFHYIFYLFHIKCNNDDEYNKKEKKR